MQLGLLRLGKLSHVVKMTKKFLVFCKFYVILQWKRLQQLSRFKHFSYQRPVSFTKNFNFNFQFLRLSF